MMNIAIDSVPHLREVGMLPLFKLHLRTGTNFVYFEHYGELNFDKDVADAIQVKYPDMRVQGVWVEFLRMQ